MGLCLKMVTKICLTCGISVITGKNDVQFWALSHGGDEERAEAVATMTHRQVRERSRPRGSDIGLSAPPMA